MASHLQVHSSLRRLSGLSSTCSSLPISLDKPSDVLLRAQRKSSLTSNSPKSTSSHLDTTDRDSLAIPHRLHITQMATTMPHHKRLQVITATLPTTAMTLPHPTTTKSNRHLPAPATSNPAPAISYPTPALATSPVRLTHTITLQPQQPPPQPKPLLQTIQRTTTERPEPKSTPRTLPSLTTPELRSLVNLRRTKLQLVNNFGAKSWMAVGH